MSDWTSVIAEVPTLSLELPRRGTADFCQSEVCFIDNTTTLIWFGGLTLLTGPACLHKVEHALSQYHGDHFDDAGAWQLDKMRPIASTADAVDQLTASDIKHGWLPVRLRRISDG
jgi:hypothetical protein